MGRNRLRDWVKTIAPSGRVVGSPEVTVLLALVSEWPVTAKAANGLWHVTSELDVQPLAPVYTQETHDLSETESGQSLAARRMRYSYLR